MMTSSLTPALASSLTFRQSERLPLFDAFPSRGRFLLNAGSLLLIDGMTDYPSCESPDRGSDQRAGTGVMACRVTDDRARAGADGTAGQCARGRIVRPPLGRVTPRQNNPGSQDCNN